MPPQVLDYYSDHVHFMVGAMPLPVALTALPRALDDAAAHSAGAMSLLWLLLAYPFATSEAVAESSDYLLRDASGLFRALQVGGRMHLACMRLVGIQRLCRRGRKARMRCITTWWWGCCSGALHLLSSPPASFGAHTPLPKRAGMCCCNICLHAGAHAQPQRGHCVHAARVRQLPAHPAALPAAATAHTLYVGDA